MKSLSPQKFFFVLWLLPLMSLHSFAAESLNNLYEARVPLSDRSSAAREEAISQGLEQVLIRYSGYSGVSSLSGVASALDNAQSYVIEFAVEALEIPAEDELAVEDAEGLWIRYNASQVDQLVDRLQLPIWPSLRPSVRYLVVQELWAEPMLMTTESYPAMMSALEQTLSARGLPATIYNPQILSADEIWELTEVDAYQLLNDSGGDLLILIKVAPDRVVGATSEVVIVEESNMLAFRERTGSAIRDVTSILHDFVDGYSVDRAFLGGSGQTAEIFLSVLGLGGFDSYRTFLEVLSSIEQVTSARLEAFKGDQMMFRIAYGANHERLLSAIMRQTALTENPQYQNALGTRQNPLLLIQEGYPVSGEVEPIFVPQVVAPFNDPLLPGSSPLSDQNELDASEPLSRPAQY